MYFQSYFVLLGWITAWTFQFHCCETSISRITKVISLHLEEELFLWDQIINSILEKSIYTSPIATLVYMYLFYLSCILHMCLWFFFSHPVRMLRAALFLGLIRWTQMFISEALTQFLQIVSNCFLIQWTVEVEFQRNAPEFPAVVALGRRKWNDISSSHEADCSVSSDTCVGSEQQFGSSKDSHK